MSILTPISYDFAIQQWNDFLSSFTYPVPFSFNPSLFDFYTSYFHWKPYYFFLISEEKPVAVCPLINTGKSWVSLPHFSYGGFAAIEYNDVSLNEKLIKKLIYSIKEEKSNSGFFQVAIHSLTDQPFIKKKFFVRTIYKNYQNNNFYKISSFIHLPKTKKELLTNINANLRRKIHKAENSDFETKIGGKELLDSFYYLYVRKMHQLGSPAYGKGFFETLLEVYRYGNAKIFLVIYKGITVGAAFLLSYMNFYENSWFATDKIAYKHYVSDYLHIQMMQYAIMRNAQIYSFGRSTIHSTVYQYKSHWPITDIPIYQYGNGLNSYLKDYKWLADVWKKLPFFLVKPIGPLLVKNIY